jgi:hypothetical protein
MQTTDNERVIGKNARLDGLDPATARRDTPKVYCRRSGPRSSISLGLDSDW